MCMWLCTVVCVDCFIVSRTFPKFDELILYDHHEVRHIGGGWGNKEINREGEGEGVVDIHNHRETSRDARFEYILSTENRSVCLR